MECNGEEALVTLNLYSMLLRLRHTEHPRQLWVDALCINQAPDPAALRERELQVQMMNRVYLQAQEVVVDLGGAGRAFEALLLTFCKLNAEPLNSFETAVREKRVLEAFKELHCKSSFWSAYEDFMKRPWFTRVWVVQEFVLAKHVTMMVGRAKFPSDFLIRVLERVMWHLNTLTAAVQWDPMYAVNFHQIKKKGFTHSSICVR
jgi:hypothetical protein